jgi:uncharacterized membrane protein
MLGPAKAQLDAQDFAGLSYTDPEGDDYKFHMEGKGTDLTITDSYGVKGKLPEVDIVRLEASFSAGKVTVEVEHAGNVNIGVLNNYFVFFVESAHQQSGYYKCKPLLNPEDLTESGVSIAYSDTNHTIVYLKVDKDPVEGIYAMSSFPMDSLTADVSGNTITFEVSAEDLETAGVTNDTGFGVYAFSGKIQGMPGQTWFQEVSWDAAGLGAASAPDEFNVEAAGGIMDMTIWIIIIVVIIIVVVAAVGGVAVSRKRKRQREAAEESETEETEDTEYEETEYEEGEEEEAYEEEEEEE